MLDENRSKIRLIETVRLFLFKPIKAITPSLLTISLPILTKSLIANTIYEVKEEEKLRIIDKNDIYEIGKKYD
jgi:hypothetical protein